MERIGIDTLHKLFYEHRPKAGHYAFLKNERGREAYNDSEEKCAMPSQLHFVRQLAQRENQEISWRCGTIRHGRYGAILYMNCTDRMHALKRNVEPAMCFDRFLQKPDDAFVYIPNF